MMRATAIILLFVATACAARPDALGDTSEPASHANTTTQIELLFTGDLMQHTPQHTAALRDGRYDYTESFAAVAPLFRAADLTVVNLETTLTEEPPYTGYPLFRSPAALAEALVDAGVDVVCMANNHALDGGGKGVRSTAAILDRHALQRTGVFTDTLDHRTHRILRLDVAGFRLALINYTYGTNGLRTPDGMIVHRIDTVQLVADLNEMRDADCRIVCLHWGNEYERRPNTSQRQLAAQLRRAGADLIIGHHPHVIQPYEADSTGAVFYSLGNLVSNQRRRYRDGGLLARIRLTRTAEGTIRYASEAVPVWVDRRGYRILPCAIADTMALGEAYRTFRADTDSLLSGR